MKARQQWMAMLAKLVAPMDAAHAAKALADMLPMLQDFPDGAFTLDSLEAVATDARGVPSYGALRSSLALWWQRHQPAIAAPQRDNDGATKARREHEEAEADWRGITPAQISAKFRAIEGAWQQDVWGRALGKHIKTHAPHHLGHVPPKYHPRDDEAVVIPLPEREDPPERPKPAYLSPEQLAKARANA